MLKSVRKHAGPQRSRGRWWILVAAAAVGIGLAVTSQAAVVRGYIVPSASMSPTLDRNDRICAVTGVRIPSPRRGEIWLFRAPRAASASEGLFIKRVVGVPGDTVQVSLAGVVVNGAPLNEPYIQVGPGYSTAPVRLKANEYYLLGDNRPNSNDSHVWGPISRDRFVGRAEFRYWPLTRLGGL